jgi:probable rRNA maturation factor
MDSDSSHSIVVTVEAPDWASVVTDPEGFCSRIAGGTLARVLGPEARAAELGVVLADDAAVRALNRTWRGRDEATNVLSFPTGDDPRALGVGLPWLLGDVVLGLETVEREALASGRAATDHLAHLVVHGVLHLLGHDHEDEGEAVAMEHLESELLTSLGLADPYADAPQQLAEVAR